MRGSVRLLILAFVFPALLLVGSSPVGAVNNSLRLGYVVGDILWTPTPDYSELTHLSIPAGTWLVTVTATVDAAIDETTGH